MSHHEYALFFFFLFRRPKERKQSTNVIPPLVIFFFSIQDLPGQAGKAQGPHGPLPRNADVPHGHAFP